MFVKSDIAEKYNLVFTEDEMHAFVDNSNFQIEPIELGFEGGLGTTLDTENGIYFGEFADKQADGYGVYIDKDGKLYIGEFKKGRSVRLLLIDSTYTFKKIIHLI